MSEVAIIDSGCANIASVAFAVERCGGRAFATVEPERIKSADRVILPGVGAAGTAMKRLKETGLDRLLPTLRQPLLGICLGMQVMCEATEEGDVPCLGILPGKAVPIPPSDGFRVPHMGWNQLAVRQSDDPLLAGLGDGSYVYFAHGYCLPVDPTTIAECNYSGRFSAIVRRDNFWACQFHPERSGKVGAKIIRNFMEVRC
jgi:glutamine amidotransferase